MGIVGADGKATKSQSATNESIQKNSITIIIDTSWQWSSRRYNGLFPSNSYGGTSFVDTTTAYNDVNDKVNEYLCSTLSQFFSAYDLCDRDRHVLKCISLARAIPFSCSDVDKTDIIPNSGATLTMRKHRHDFEDDYQACTDIFV